MKRPHRRFHIMVWFILAPIVAVTSVLFWMQRPSEPVSDLPPGIESVEED